MPGTVRGLVRTAGKALGYMVSVISRVGVRHQLDDDAEEENGLYNQDPVEHRLIAQALRRRHY